MATYYQESSELQADGLQTLYLMNPNDYVGLSDNQHDQSSPTNMFFFNENNSAATPTVPAVSHAPLTQAEQFVGIPISHEYPRHSSALDQEEEIHGSRHNTIFLPRFGHCSLWGASVDQTAAGNQPKMCQQTSKVLSLSLSPHQETFIDDKSVHGYQDFSGQSSNGMMFSPKNSTSYSSMISTVPNGINTVQSVITGAKYLKAAKQLLDEVVSVGKCIEYDGPKGANYKVKKRKESLTLNVKASSTGGENGGKGGGVELTIPQRQELQMKKAKLLCVLDEVEQRNRQYRHQMQIVVESLEQVAGIGSAKSYTNLALNTILKQFKCLKDAISGQVKDLNKTLGEEQGLKDGSRVVKIIEHQLRQENTSQQLGMMQNNAWRSQRGLPERAVLVLRAWLFENFLHPYPKDSDKQMLAKQTGLTRSQVSNWFINARVRLWKPMVEEMYLEEIKNHEEDQDQVNSDENCTIKNEPEIELGSNQDKNTEKTDHVSSLQSKPQNLQVPSPAEISASTVITTSPTTTQLPGFAQLITSLNMGNIPENNPKKPRNRLDTQNNSPNSTNSQLSNEMEMKESRKGFTDNNFISNEQKYFNSTRFGYEIEELGLRFNNTGQMPTSQIFHRNNNNNVFLTLALPPPQNSSQSAARNHHDQNFHSNPNFEYGTRIESGVSHTSRVNGLQDSNIGYDQILGFQNRKTFPSQLLPDFVA